MIREISPDDWLVWRELRLRSLREDPQAFSASTAAWTGDLDTEDRWRDRIVAPGACFVAFDDGDDSRPLAMAAALPIGMVAAIPADDGSVELISMWVAPDARGHGVGAALVSAVIDWALLAPAACAIHLRVMDGNQAAIWLYERCGFVLRDDRLDGEGCRAMTIEPSISMR